MNGRGLSDLGPMGPITPHGSVVVNVAFDSTLLNIKNSAKDTHWQARNQSENIVAKGDLVFRYNKGCKRKRCAYNEPELKVFSTVNGMPKIGADDNVEDYRKLVTFIGVSNGDLVPGPSKHTSATVAGLVTIKNTGPMHICAGDKIVWDVPSVEDATGGRKPFITLPYAKALSLRGEEAHGFADALSEAIEAARNGGDQEAANPSVAACVKAFASFTAAATTDEETKQKLKNFIKCVSEASRELDSRIIGVAMSDAKQNEAMDVLIRYGK